MKRINPSAVELSEAEHTLQEWHDSLLDVGYGPNTAIEKMFDSTPTGGVTWKLLNNQEFRDYLATMHTCLMQESDTPIVHVLSPGEVQVIEELRLKNAEVLDSIHEICGAIYTTAGSDLYATECDLKPGHYPDSPHESDDPMDAANLRVRWKGGGSAGGDRMPIRNVKFIPKGA